MLDAIKAFFQDNMQAPAGEQVETGAESENAEKPNDHQPLHLAACALLLEIAYADDEFAESERAHIKGSVQRHFGLSAETAEELISLAERERSQSVDLYQFTSLIAESYDLPQKMVLLETMWGLVYADGEVAKHETYLMRKLSKLLDVKAGYLTEARKKAQGLPPEG
jgi:uncharacterized tellurite resistance protein B-like protein